MKILFYNHTGLVSGAERSLMLAIGATDRDVFDMAVVCPADGALMPTVRELGLEWLPIDSLESRFTWNPLSLGRYCLSVAKVKNRFGEIVRRVQPDLIHANSVRAGIVASLATSGMNIPVVWHIRDLLRRHPISSLIRRYAYGSKHTHLLAITQATADAFKGGSKSEKSIEVLLNAIDVQRFKFDQNVRSEMRRKFEIGKDQLVVGIVGQVTPWKGQLGLIRAFRQVAVAAPDALLLIVGSPLFNKDKLYQEKLVSETTRLGLDERVRFLGQQENVQHVMQAFDLLVLNSWAEPFGLVIVEGMALGLPVLATNAGGVPEILKHGESGWLTPPKDDGALAGSIGTLLRNGGVRSRIGQRAKNQAWRRFSINGYASKLADYHHKVLSDHSTPATSVVTPSQTGERVKA